MANTSDELEKVDEAQEDINDILSNIKDVITSSSPPSNVLVLTEQVEDELESTSANDKGLSQSNTPTTPAPTTISQAVQNLPKSPDILEQLDADFLADAQSSQGRKTEPSEIESDSTNQAPSAANSLYDKLLRDDVAMAAKATISNILQPQNTPDNKPESVAPSLNGSKSFEDVAINLLRVELQGWLNDNLPDIVKNIVENEIKRIIPK